MQSILQRRIFSLSVCLFASLLMYGNYADIHAQQNLLPGQWATTNLVAGTRVRALLSNGSSLLAGTETGVWQTIDNGANWTQINSGLATQDVRALAISGTTLYAGTFGGGVFRSTDGTNWTAFNTGLQNGTIYSLAVSGSDVFAGTGGGGVFRSAGGAGWTAVNTGISSGAQVYSLLATGNDLYAAGVLVVNDFHHIYRSTDRGATWKATGGNDPGVNKNPPANVYSMAVSGNAVLSATSDGLYRSTDSAANWQRVEKLPLSVLSLLPVSDPSVVYASGVTQNGELYGVSVSSDNGLTWRASSYGLPGASVLAFSGTRLYAGASANAGVAASTTQPVTAASVSAASYLAVKGHAPAAIASLFGTALATGQASAATVPLPTSLLGTSVKIIDSLGAERPAPLFYVSANQVNYQIPTGTATGWAHLTITNGAGVVSYATANITSAALSLFTANSSGTGIPAAYVHRIKANGSVQLEPIGSFDAAQQKWVPIPIDLGPDGEQVFLVLFGTGIRGLNPTLNPVICYFQLDAVTYVPMQADYAGSQNEFVGLDQVNVRLPRSLSGRGDISLYITSSDGSFSNNVTINVK